MLLSACDESLPEVAYDLGLVDRSIVDATSSDMTAADTSLPMDAALADTAVIDMSPTPDMASMDMTSTPDTTVDAIIPCGDGIIDADDEECDDGNQVDDDGCTNACTEPVCGDGILQESVTPSPEECDEGADNSNSGWCLEDCSIGFCGDALWGAFAPCSVI